LQYTRECIIVNRHVAFDSLFSIIYLTRMTTLSDALRDAIRESGMTQDAIAREVDISAGIISRFMRAERSMTLDTAEKLCAYFKLELHGVVKRGRK